MLNFRYPMKRRQSTTKKRVLVVEDEELMRSIIRKLLEEAGFEIFTASSGEAALSIVSESGISVTLTDIKMSGIDGIELLDQIKSIDESALVIIMTAFSSVDSAIAALRKGAYDYITKPFVNEDLVKTVTNAYRHRELFNENKFLRRELNRRIAAPEMIGGSPEIQKIRVTIAKIAKSNATILIKGESGTGKELVAKAIHFGSDRADRPFLAINCGALSEGLLESELFGHVRGAFTGAITDKPGLFRSAEGGTLLLDEIGETSPAIQVRLLRALQEREVTPVGSSLPQRFDTRIIAATNRNLEKEVAEGRFREDLFYRLNIVEVVVPSLRDRREDIPELVGHFITKLARSYNVPVKTVEPATTQALLAYDWPGNIRELENTIERAFVLSDHVITPDSLPPKIHSGADRGRSERSLESVERNHILDILGSVGGDKVEAAKVLAIDLSTLYRKLKKYEQEGVSSTAVPL
jgi:two-component system response regulator AtoC